MPRATCPALARLAGAAAVLIGALVCRASYPGVLKNLLDLTPIEAVAWQAHRHCRNGRVTAPFSSYRLSVAPGIDLVRRAGPPTAVYLTGNDFRDGRLAWDDAQADWAALVSTLATLARLDPKTLGPVSLAAKFT